MTIEQTRQLGIEFERRIQAIMPSEEFANKLDTDTIYAYLNEYLMQYVHSIYRSLDKLEPGTTLTAHVEAVLQSMMSSFSANVDDVDYVDPTDELIANSGWNSFIKDSVRSHTFRLPDDYYMYIRSVSKVSKTFSWNGGNNAGILPNVYTKQTDIWKVLETPHDSLRILRYPCAMLDENLEYGSKTITVIYDRYTDVDGIKVFYYKEPKYFGLMTSTPCELPLDSFDDLVSGAVQLYLSYALGAINQQKKQQQEQAKRELKQQNGLEDNQ